MKVEVETKETKVYKVELEVRFPLYRSSNDSLDCGEWETWYKICQNETFRIYRSRGWGSSNYDWEFNIEGTQLTMDMVQGRGNYDKAEQHEFEQIQKEFLNDISRMDQA